MKYILSLIFIINTSLNVIEKKYWVCHVNVDYPDIDLCYVRLIEADSEVAFMLITRMWPLGDWTFRADYKVLEIDNGKYVFQSVTHPARDYKLLNIGDGYCEVVSKYRA